MKNLIYAIMIIVLIAIQGCAIGRGNDIRTTVFGTTHVDTVYIKTTTVHIDTIYMNK